MSYIETLSWFISSLHRKEKGKSLEANCAYQDNDIFDPSNLTNLDVVDFFETLEEKTDTVDGTTNVSFDFENI